MVRDDRGRNPGWAIGDKEDVSAEMLDEKFRRAIERHHLIDQGDRLIVGVSGGVDSMVLLHLLNACRHVYRFDLIIAHVNHRLRPVESEREAALVRREAGEAGHRYEYGEFDVKGFARERGLSLQEAARRIRFQFFHTLLEKHGAQKIVLGHHADDQVETMLLRLLRGSGLKGLKGMLPIREGRVIRPLLDVWKQEIELYAADRRIPHLVDSTNLKETYLRNRIRLKLIPMIERDFQPNFKKAMKRMSSLLRQEDDFLESKAREAYGEIIREERDGLSFEWDSFNALHPAIRWRVLEKILADRSEGKVLEDRDYSEVSRICQRLNRPKSSFSVNLSGGVHLEKRYGRVFLKAGTIPAIPSFEVDLVVPGHTLVKVLGSEVVVEEIPWKDRKTDFSGFPATAFFDYNRLLLPLKLRSFRPGDRFQPLGLKGTQKLKDFLIDHKIPKFERARIPLLISGENIIWVVGHRIDERFKVTKETRRVLKVTFISTGAVLDQADEVI
jgi:tRNA(Ile)-lysidine synthase